MAADPGMPACPTLQSLWLAWFLCLLFHTDLGLMPLFHGQSPAIASQVPAERLPQVFGAMALYFLFPLLAWLLNSYAAAAEAPARGLWRRWRWWQLGFSLLYSLTNIAHLLADLLIPDSRPDQVLLMAVMVVIGLLINRESWRWCRGR
jgi:hypothetical protein